MKVSELQVDITTYCNSHCGGCIRNKDGGESVVDLTHLSVETFKKIDFNNIIKVYFNGSYGDFTSHPNFFEILDCIPENVKVDGSTNGSARNPDWWKQLAIKLKKFSRGRITFAVDGLETNEIYRRGCNIDSILQNMKAFIDSGGNARWKYIVFKHNEHEVMKASHLAKDMGFQSFELVESYSEKIYHKKYKKFNECYAIKGKVKKEYEWPMVEPSLEEFNNNSRCLWRRERKIQIDAWGNVWQCCYMPAISTHPDLYKELNLLNLDNNLRKYDYNDIIHGSFFTELFDEPLELCKNCKEWT